MSKGNTFENDFLKLIFQATAIANIADNAATSPLTELFLSLHTADPGEAGNQTTSECAYGSYARKNVARTSGGFTVTNNQVTLVADQSFPQATSGSETALFFAVGTATSGTGKVLYKGPIGSVQGPFTAATNDNITIPGHSFSVDDRIAFFPLAVGSALPTGITEGTVYWVKTVSSEVITISTTQGGATLDITAIGDGVAVKVTPIVISSGVTPILTTGTTITED